MHSTTYKDVVITPYLGLNSNTLLIKNNNFKEGFQSMYIRNHKRLKYMLPVLFFQDKPLHTNTHTKIVALS